jgi:hypothetical protein
MGINGELRMASGIGADGAFARGSATSGWPPEKKASEMKTFVTGFGNSFRWWRMQCRRQAIRQRENGLSGPTRNLSFGDLDCRSLCSARFLPEGTPAPSDITCKNWVAELFSDSSS